jgi:DNA polymerase (family 10)
LKGRPYLLRRLRELGAASTGRTQRLTRDGILTLADLELAIGEGRPVLADSVLVHAAAALVEEPRSLTLGRSLDVLNSLLTHVTAGIPEMDWIEPSGEVRRFEAQPTGLVAVGSAADPASVVGAMANLRIFTDVLHRTERRVIAVFQTHEVDLRVTTRDEFGSLLFTTTGPASHVVEIQRRRGPRLSATEREVYTQAGLSYVPPELRHATDVLQAAAEGLLPPLVTRDDIRGDLHMHTTYSDGRDSLYEMVATCCELGYEYIAITDHSEHAAASRTLDGRGLERQRDDIARARDQFPQIQILHGIEADILPDGRIDCPDEVMASLDIVLASLHERQGQNGAQLTARCMGAIRHPLVSVITHPQNQLVGHRTGYDMDYPAIYEAAAETGTVLEIDGAPTHLDLDGDHAWEAVSRGVTVAIDSDCHRASSLDRQMRLGIGTARRGRVERRHVLNARSLADVRAFIARKRNAR